MKYQFFAIPALDPTQAQQNLNAFLNRHAVANVDRQFVADGNQSFWAVCVGYASRRQRFQQRRRAWERAYEIGHIDEQTLQSAFDAVLAITHHADSLTWRQNQLFRKPPPDL